MPETLTEGAQTKEAEVATQVVVEAPKPPEPPQGKTYTEAEAKRLVDEEVLKVRREGTKREERLKVLEGKVQLSEAQARELTTLRESVSETQLMIATLLDAQGVAGNGPSYTERLQAKLKPQVHVLTPEEQAAQMRQMQETVRLEEIVAEVEPTEEEFAEARTTYSTKGFAATTKYLKGLATTRKNASVKESPDDVEKRIEARLRKELGLDSVDTSASIAAGGKRIYKVSELADKRFVRAHWADIQLAEQEGRIKE